MALRRSTAEMALQAGSRNLYHTSSRRITDTLPWKSPFEAHAQTVTRECESSCSSSNKAGGDSEPSEERCYNDELERKQSAFGQPENSATSRWQNPQASSIGSAEEVTDTSDAAGMSLLENKEEGSLACSIPSPHTARMRQGSIAADASIVVEMEMVSLAPEKHHDASEQHNSILEELMGSEVTGQGRRSLPGRTPSEASLARPKFNLMVYAGWVSPSLRTSPIGAWIDDRLTDGHMGSSELSSADRSTIHSLDLSSKLLLPLQ